MGGLRQPTDYDPRKTSGCARSMVQGREKRVGTRGDAQTLTGARLIWRHPGVSSWWQNKIHLINNLQRSSCRAPGVEAANDLEPRY